MALLANQIMDARILSSMNGRVELSQFLRVTSQSIVTQVTSAQEDNRKNRKYPCPLCGKRFRFNSILSLHMRTHTGEKPFKCPYCDHRAAQKGNLKIHLRTHKQGILGKGRGRVREESRLLHELEERAILRDRQMRAGHVSSEHPQTSSLIQKQNLGAVPAEPLFFSSSAPSASAYPKVATVPDEPLQAQANGFRCSFCKGKFRKQQELERHIRILHKPYKCTLCDFAAAHEEELIGHVEMTHITADLGSGQKPPAGTGDKGKPAGEFPCEVCGQTFSQAWFLKGHMRKHKDSFEHCCQICGRRFKEPWFLKNHMKVHLNKLAAKSIPDHNSATDTGGLTPDLQSSIYSQYIPRIHNRFLMSERADLPDYHQLLNTAGSDMKVREMLGRMVSSGPGPLTDPDSSSLLSFNHLQPPLSSTSMEYLQRVISTRDALNNSSTYTGWQIITPGMPIEQQMFNTKDQQQQQRSSYLSERSLPGDDGKLGLSDSDSKVLSRPGSQEPAEMSMEPDDAFDLPLQSSSPSAGEKVFRGQVSGDYAAATAAAHTASLGFHHDHYQFPHWQSDRDGSSPLQPSSSRSSSPKARSRPRSREDWSLAAGQYINPESHGEKILLASKKSETADKDAGVDGPRSAQARKSQYEPLDLSVRPDSHSAVSPAVLMQMSGLFSNGLSSSVSRGLQSSSHAPAELSMKPAYQRDLLVQGTNEEMTSQNAGSIGQDKVGDYQEDKSDDDAAKWKKLKKDLLEPMEPGQASADSEADRKLKRGRAASSLERLTHVDPLQQQGVLLSFLRSQGSLSRTPASALQAGLNGNMEKDVASAQKPFQCRYCPYSASQKGNLKTHVLCVHRKPFDNSLYPDRRLRRSHAPQVLPRLPVGVAGGDGVSGRDQISSTSLCGT